MSYRGREVRDLLERLEGRLSRAVLRGLGGSNALPATRLQVQVGDEVALVSGAGDYQPHRFSRVFSSGEVAFELDDGTRYTTEGFEVGRSRIAWGRVLPMTEVGSRTYPAPGTSGTSAWYGLAHLDQQPACADDGHHPRGTTRGREIGRWQNRIGY